MHEMFMNGPGTPQSKTTGGLSQKVRLAHSNDPKRTVRIRHLIRATRQSRSSNLFAVSSQGVSLPKATSQKPNRYLSLGVDTARRRLAEWESPVDSGLAPWRPLPGPSRINPSKARFPTKSGSCNGNTGLQGFSPYSFPVGSRSRIGLPVLAARLRPFGQKSS